MKEIITVININLYRLQNDRHFILTTYIQIYVYIYCYCIIDFVYVDNFASIKCRIVTNIT